MVFFNVFFRTFGFLSALLIFFILLNILFFITNDLKKNQFTLIEGKENSNNIIASINLNGPIFNSSNDLFENGIYNYINPNQVKLYLDELKELNIKALIIRINSPGGTVSATADLEKIFNEFKKKTNIKIYVFTNEILASGGYWIATVADHIFASYGSIIGSIGVSGPSWFYFNTPLSLSSGIFGQSIETKNGIEIFDQNAGQSKDLYNPYRRPDNNEIRHLQSIVDEIYYDFISKVSKSRKIDINYVQNNIGALIYSSKQAKDNFLIDQILDYETMVDFIVKENQFENYKIIENNVSNSLLESLITKYKSETNIKHSYENICRNLEISINVLIPTFLKNC